MSAEHTIETMYNTFLINHPKYDARLRGRDVKLTTGDAPAGNDPRLFAYLEMQTTECLRSSTSRGPAWRTTR